MGSVNRRIHRVALCTAAIGVLLVITVWAYFGLTQHYDVRIVDEYRLFKAARDQITLCRNRSVVVGSQIMEIGWNDRFIIGLVEANPRVSNIAEESSGYFIIDRLNDEIQLGQTREVVANALRTANETMPTLRSPDFWRFVH